LDNLKGNQLKATSIEEKPGVVRLNENWKAKAKTKPEEKLEALLNEIILEVIYGRSN
jgi:hypothetical protein